MIYVIYICISRPARRRQYFSANTVGLQHAALRSSQRWVCLCTGPRQEVRLHCLFVRPVCELSCRSVALGSAADTARA